ncbi:MAG: glycosyltransferase family 4 protein, partial [Caldilineaceae bacterium]|nr:glycosyltransferase family 4 protein [Caldilineaceae bacterium]
MLGDHEHAKQKASGTERKYIAITCQHFYPEMLSTGLFITHIATGLVQNGWRVRVYCSRPSYLPKAENPQNAPLHITYQGVEVIRVPTLSTARDTLSRRLLNAITFLLSIAWYLFRDRKELLGVVNTTNPPFLGVVAWLAKRLLGLPYLTIVHDIYPDVAVQTGLLARHSPVTWLWERITRLIFNGSAGLVVIGRDMAELVRMKLRRNQAVPMTLIPHWAEPTVVYPVPKAENSFVAEYELAGRFIVQYSGRMGRVHNLEPLIEAAAQLQDTSVLFQFIGDGAKRKLLEERVQQLGLTNVQFLPYQPYETMAHVLSAADLAVVALDGRCNGVSVPSKTYGLLAAARPVLALMDPMSEIGQMVHESGCGIVLPHATGTTI